MNNLLPISPEISTACENLSIRHDLINNSVIVYFKDVNLWHVDTSQVSISENVIHFIQPDKEIVGIKCFSVREAQQ